MYWPIAYCKNNTTYEFLGPKCHTQFLKPFRTIANHPTDLANILNKTKTQQRNTREKGNFYLSHAKTNCQSLKYRKGNEKSKKECLSYFQIAKEVTILTLIFSKKMSNLSNTIKSVPDSFYLMICCLCLHFHHQNLQLKFVKIIEYNNSRVQFI